MTTTSLTGFAVSLNVPAPEISAQFLVENFGYAVDMEHDGVVSLKHPDGGSNVIFLRTGLATFKPAEVAGRAGDGLLLVHVTDDLDGHHQRLADAGVDIVTEPETEPWGERFSQYRDPNGLIVQLVQWV